MPVVETPKKLVTAEELPDILAIRVYSGDQEVSGEEVIPGFSFRPRDVFDPHE